MYSFERMHIRSLIKVQYEPTNGPKSVQPVTSFNELHKSHLKSTSSGSMHQYFRILYQIRELTLFFTAIMDTREGY